MRGIRRAGGLAAAVGLTLTLGATATATTPPTGSDAGAAPSAEAGPGDFGDLKAVCGPGDAKGSTDQGVSDTEIVVGTASDPGNAILPGLNQEIFDAADAFVGWCNEAGGILGRKLKLNKHDAKLFEAGPRMVEACQTDFMLVGAGMVFDDQANEPRLECGLSEIAGYAVSETAGQSDNLLIGMATSIKTSAMEPLYKQVAAADAAVKPYLGMWNLATPSVIPVGKRDLAGAIRQGYTPVLYEEVPTAVDNWRPYVEALKDKNVQVLQVLGSPENLVAAMRTMNDVGFFPKYILVSTNYYNTKLTQEGGDLLDKSYVVVFGGFPPFEQADQFPAIARYIENLKTYAGGAEPRGLGVNGTSAWLAFAVAAKECGSDLTRACVMEKAAAITDWTAGGMHPPRPLSNLNGAGPTCYFTYRATSKGFELDPMTPANDGIYSCAADNFPVLPGS